MFSSEFCKSVKETTFFTEYLRLTALKSSTRRDPETYMIP